MSALTLEAVALTALDIQETKGTYKAAQYLRMQGMPFSVALYLLVSQRRISHEQAI